MPQNNVPRNLQGGPSFTYNDGPRASRSRPADIDEIIHFVRTQGIARESTEMRLLKKAPLPGIGQTQPMKCKPKSENDHNSSSLDTDNTEGTDEAYEFDTDFQDINDNNRQNIILSPTSNHNSLGVNLNHGLTKSLEAMQYSNQQNMNMRTPLKPLGQKGRLLDHSPTRNPRAVRTLPPMILHERPLGAHARTMPNRPNAPSPSVTISDVMEEDTEDFIEA